MSELFVLSLRNLEILTHETSEDDAVKLIHCPSGFPKSSRSLTQHITDILKFIGADSLRVMQVPPLATLLCEVEES